MASTNYGALDRGMMHRDEIQDVNQSLLTVGEQNATSVHAKRDPINIGLRQFSLLACGRKHGAGRSLTPARLARYKTVPAMSLSQPGLLAGTRSKRALKTLPSAPTGFILLGTTVPWCYVRLNMRFGRQDGAGTVSSLHPGLMPTART